MAMKSRGRFIARILAKMCVAECSGSCRARESAAAGRCWPASTPHAYGSAVERPSRMHVPVIGLIQRLYRVPLLDQQGMVLPRRRTAGTSSVAPPRRKRRWLRVLASLLRIASGVILLGALVVLVRLGHEEMRHSRWQARWLSEFAASIGYRLEPGPAREPLRADRGPYDVRLGYAQLPEFGTAWSGPALRSAARRCRRGA